MSETITMKLKLFYNYSGKNPQYNETKNSNIIFKSAQYIVLLLREDIIFILYFSISLYFLGHQFSLFFLNFCCATCFYLLSFIKNDFISHYGFFITKAVTCLVILFMLWPVVYRTFSLLFTILVAAPWCGVWLD